jgi:hypothetical protein
MFKPVELKVNTAQSGAQLSQPDSKISIYDMRDPYNDLLIGYETG